jgi:RNA polymerase sigma-70 factor (ECF subfamily)
MTQADQGQRRQWVLSLLEQFELPLLRFAKRLLGNEDVARDVVQHTFLRLCEQSPEELGERVRPWLFCVCRNRAIDYLRSQHHVTSLDSADISAQANREPNPADVVDNRDLCEMVRRLVDRLPASQREALTLWTEGFEYRQIAEIVGTSEGNVRVLMHRALKHVRRDVTELMAQR